MNLHLSKAHFKSQLTKFERPLVLLVVSAVITAILVNIDFNMLESKLYDFRIVYGRQPKPSQDIVLVAVDLATTKELDEYSPLSLEHHTRFLETLEKYEPKAVGFLIDFNQVNQVNPDQFQPSQSKPDWGNRFVNSAMKLKAQGTEVMLGTPYDVTGEVVPPFPLSKLPHSIAIIHKDGNLFSEDKVTRRALIALNEKPVFHLAFARAIGAISGDTVPRGTYSVPEIDADYFFFRFSGTTVSKMSNSSEPNVMPYPSIRFSDILNGKVSADAIKGKTLLVGTLSKEDWSDYAFTPYSKRSFINPKLVIHAHILDAVTQNRGVILVPPMITWVSSFLVIAAVLFWVMSSSPLGGVFSTMGLALLFIAISHVLFQWGGFWIREAQPLVGIFLGYYLTVPYRLMKEYEKRWDYQRKNELLTQVEELKTNFLSLVTHDLKTPVARIQGLAEVLLKKSAARLVDRDIETINNIIGSTDELNRFISSILELSKVESNRLQIKFESRDINRIIETSVDTFKAPAKARGLKISAHLEPLFPIRVDGNLITKVLNTLIDNAIKYSTPDTEIQIESKEQSDWVIISVKDGGIGMSEEEQEQLFTRFYRAKNDLTVQIPGTGLGLYLTKYFIEAHRGRVEVESEKGAGSKFSIYLPIGSDKEIVHV